MGDVQNIVQAFVSYAPTMIFLFILLVGVIAGLIRGFRKSSILAIHALVVFLTCLIAYLVIVNNDKTDYNIVSMVNRFAGDGFLQEQLGASPESKSLTEILLEVIPKSLDYGDGVALVVEENGAYLGAIVNMAYHIIFAIVFTIIYYISIFILYIIYVIFYPERRYVRKQKRKLANLATDKPYSKKRLLGAVVGGCRGLVSGLIYMSFLGALFFVIAGGTGESKTEDYDFGDENINLGYSLYQSVGEYGSTGIFKILNTIKDGDDVPFYLFAADLVFSGGYTDKETGLESNISLIRELEAYTRFTEDTFNLILKYDTDYAVRRYLANEEELDLLEEVTKILSKEEFQEEFGVIIDDFSDNTYFIDFGLSLVDSIAKNLNNTTFVEGMDADTLELLNILFTPGYKSSYVPEDNNVETPAYLTPSKLMTKNDVKSLVLTAMSLIEYASKIEDASTDDYVDIVTGCADKVVTTITELSIFSDSRKNEMNPLIERLYSYFANKYLTFEEEQISLSSLKVELAWYYETSIDWVAEIKSLISLVGDAVVLVDNVYEPAPDGEELDILGMVFDVFDETHENYESSQEAYGNIKDSITNSSLLSLVLSETDMYQLLEDQILAIAPEAYIPDDINYLNKLDDNGNVVEYGEVYNLLSAVEMLLSDSEARELAQSIVETGVDTDSILGILDLANTAIDILYKGDNGERIVDIILDSRIVLSVASGLIIGNKNIDEEMNLVLYIPEDSLEVVDGAPVNIIKKEEFLLVLDNVPELYDAIYPCIVEDGDSIKFEDINGLVTRLTASNGDLDVIDSLLESDILEGTLVNVISGLINQQEEISEYIAMPSWYKDAFGRVNVEAWLENEEISKLVHGIARTGLDFDGFMTINELEGSQLQAFIFDQIELLGSGENNSDNGPITTLLSSKVLHYTVSHMLLDFEYFGYSAYVPVDCLENGLVKAEEIKNTIMLIPTLAEAIESFLDKEHEDYNSINALVDRLTIKNGENDIIDDILDCNILEGTIVNVLCDFLNQNEGVSKFITIPDDYKLEDGRANVDIWLENEEFSKLIRGVAESGIDFDQFQKINNLTDSQLQDLIFDQIKAVADKENSSSEGPITKLLSSKVLHYSLSNIIINIELSGFKITIPEAVMDGEVIASSQLKSTIMLIPTLSEAIEPYLDQNHEDYNKINPLVDKLVDDTNGETIVDKITNNLILEYTLISLLGDLLLGEGISEFITFPDEYIVDGVVANDKWHEDKEISNLVYGIAKSGIDFDSLMSGAGQDEILDIVLDLTNKDEETLGIILSSKLLQYTLSSHLIDKNYGGFDIIVPNSSITEDSIDKTAKAIKANELIDVLKKIPLLIDLESDTIDTNQVLKNVVNNSDELTSCKILLTTVVNYLNSGLLDEINAEDEMIVIPEDLQAKGTRDELLQYVDDYSNPWQEETPKLIKALDVVLGISTNDEFVLENVIDLVSNNVKNLNDLYLANDDSQLSPDADINVDTNLDIAYSSRIIKVSLTNVLNDAFVKDGIANPAAVETLKSTDALGDTYYSKLEVSNLVYSAKELGVDFADVNVSEIFEEIPKFNQESDVLPSMTRLEVIYSSDIIKFVLTYQLDQKIEDIVENADKLDIKAQLNGYDYYIEDELVALIDALNVLGMTDSFDAGNIQDTVMDLIPELNEYDDNYDDTKLGVIYTSEIIKAALSAKLIEIEALTVPSDAYDTNYVEIDVILESELSALVDAVNELEIDVDNPDLTTIKLDNDVKTVILASKIIKAVLTDEFAENDNILVPTATINEYGYFNNAEIEALLDVLIKNKATLFTEVSGKYDISSFNTDGITIAVMRDMITSDVLHATLIDNLVDMEIEGIEIPQEYIDAAEDGTLVSDFENNIWIVNEEVDKLIDSLSEFIGEDEPITEFDSAIIKTQLNEVENLDTVYASAIIKATLTAQLDTALTGVVAEDIINSDNVKENGYYKQSEIEALLDSLDILELDIAGDIAVDEINFLDLDLNSQYGVSGKTKLGVMYSSVIITYALYDNLNETLSGTVNADVLAYCEADDLVDGYNYYKLSHVSQLITAIEELGVSEVSDIENDAENIITSLGDEVKLNTIYSSVIVRDIVSSEFANFVGGENLLKDHAKAKATDINISGEYTYYSQDEIYYVVSILGEEGLEGFDIVSIEINDASIVAFQESYILAATLTDNLMSNDEIVIASSAYDSDDNLITDEEIGLLLAAYKDNNAIGFDIDPNEIIPNDITNIDSITASLIWRATITKSVKIDRGNDDYTTYITADETIVTLTQDVYGNNIYVLSAQEIGYMLEGNKAISNGDSFEISLSLEMLSGLSLETLESVVKSSIIRLLISEILVVDYPILGLTGQEEVVYDLSNVLETTTTINYALTKEAILAYFA